MKKLAIVLMIAVFAIVGCTGTFQLTKKVYHIHRDQRDKWVDEILFLVLVIVPVYDIAILADGIVFNSIEFWTGKNPVVSNQDARNVIAQTNGDKVVMAYDARSRDIRVSSIDTGKSFALARTEAGVVAKDGNGQVLFTSVEDSSGGVTIFDARNNPVRHFSPEMVQAGRAGYFY